MKTHVYSRKLLVLITLILSVVCVISAQQAAKSFRWRRAINAANARRSANHDGPVQERAALLHTDHQETGKESGTPAGRQSRINS